MTTDSSDDAPTIGSGASAEPAAADVPRLAAGQTLGPYTVVRLLGRGGMGEVYEAEHREHGRRVALKVLNQRLAGAGDRERFVGEGQLAALVNHPNTVYVFGSEEIAGTPVIAMELVAGGTLKDRVDREGPLPSAEAVDAVLQVVAGLDAARAQGILHRDVKPSNCFVTPDGAIKVGDFGLSIPVLAPDVTRQAEPAGVHGTPQFAAPEQLSGQTLDVRADIYSVGATLYYLLTGRPPFDEPELMALLTRVATEVPQAPHRDGATIPPGLSAVVLRCLAKDPAARPSNYSGLAEALRPFGSGVPVPANLGMRLMAGALDWFLLTIATAPATLGINVELARDNTVQLGAKFAGTGDPGGWPWTAAAVCAAPLLYYALLEGMTGRSAGKRICGLAVVAKAGGPVGVVRAAWRALLFLMPVWLLVGLASRSGGAGLQAAPAWGWRFWLPLAILYGLPVLMFSSIRRRNGLAGWHDLASGSRVIENPPRAARPVLVARDSFVPPAAAGVDRLGPFDVVGVLGQTNAEEILLGLDARLKRHVWLRMLPPGTPPLDPAIAALGRPGRLRWMTGQRSDKKAWDAFEAPDGAALAAVISRAQPWSLVKHWLADLSRELSASGADGTMPRLALDRVWITRGGEARLLDFQAPGAPDPGATGVTAASPQQFLATVARLALLGSSAERFGRTARQRFLPLSAQSTLDTLAGKGFGSLDLAAERCSALAAGPDGVSLSRRLAALSLANLPVILVTIALLAAIPTARRVLTPDFLAMAKCLIELRGMESQTQADEAKRRDIEAYVADRFAATLANETTWQDPTTTRLLTPLRPVAQRAMAAHPAISAEERAIAQAAAQPLVADVGDARHDAIAFAATVVAILLLVTSCISLASAVAFRGGPLLRLLGVAVVTSRGVRVSRLRAGWRGLAAWSPVFLLWAGAVVSALAGGESTRIFGTAWAIPTVAVALLGGSAWTLVASDRGPLDRLTGTHLVPR